MTLGKTGYADSFGKSYRDLHEGYDVLVGLSVEYPPMNRAARAADQRARLTRRQAAESVGNLAQLAEVDVRSAYLEVNRSKEQVAATAVTRRLQEEKVRAETEKFRVGKSTTLLVAQAQRDLLQSQINEVQAVVANLKAYVELFRLEGSLLERRGISAPGREPVVMPAAEALP
jgi:outer membrane protein TolC